MVYSIAAYTITIGTLALYGVLIQYRSRVASAALAEARGLPARDPRKGFNLGASLIAPFWMWRHGLRAPASSLLAVSLAAALLYQRELWIPMFFAMMIPIAAGAALGFAGNRIAVDYLEIDEPAAFASSQLPWSLVGIVIVVVILPWVLYFAGALD